MKSKENLRILGKILPFIIMACIFGSFGGMLAKDSGWAGFVLTFPIIVGAIAGILIPFIHEILQGTWWEN